jgi:hypothetical protein
VKKFSAFLKVHHHVNKSPPIPRLCVIFRNNIFYGENFLASRPSHNLEDHPCILLATAHSVYSNLPSVSGYRLPVLQCIHTLWLVQSLVKVATFLISYSIHLGRLTSFCWPEEVPSWAPDRRPELCMWSAQSPCLVWSASYPSCSPELQNRNHKLTLLLVSRIGPILYRLGA